MPDSGTQRTIQKLLEARSTIGNAAGYEGNSLAQSNRHFEPTKLSPLHEEILRRLSLGFRNKDVAIQMNVTPATIINVKYSKLGREKLRILSYARDQQTKILFDRVADIGPIAADVAEEILLDSEASANVRSRLAVDVLAMNGVSTSGKKDSSATLTPQQLDELKQNAIAAGVVVNVKAEDAEFSDS